MARFSIYVSEEELGWIKEQKPGKVRDLVKQAMTSPQSLVSSSAPESPSPSAELRLPPGVQKGVAGLTQYDWTTGSVCRSCGAKLATRGKAKCQECGWLQFNTPDLTP